MHSAYSIAVQLPIQGKNGYSHTVTGHLFSVSIWSFVIYSSAHHNSYFSEGYKLQTKTASVKNQLTLQTQVWEQILLTPLKLRHPAFKLANFRK